jgi:phosphoserine phosphatase
MDSPLTPNGLHQAAQLADRLASEGIQAIYSSDQGRAVATARAIGDRCHLPVTPTPELREIDCGEWTGKPYQEVREGWPEGFADWRTRPHLHRMPGGESVADVQQRLLRFVERVRAEHQGQTVCAVTHNTGVRVVACHLLGIPLSQLWEGAKQPNCALNLIEMRNGKAELVEIAVTDHLTSISTIGFSV